MTNGSGHFKKRHEPQNINDSLKFSKTLVLPSAPSNKLYLCSNNSLLICFSDLRQDNCKTLMTCCFPMLTIIHFSFSVAECAHGQVAGIFDKGWLGSSLQVFGQTSSQEALPAQKHSRKHS